MADEQAVTFTEKPEWLNVLIGQSVVSASVGERGGVLTLSDGTRIKLSDNEDCCSSIAVLGVTACPNIITAAELRNTDDEEGSYTAWLHVVTEAGELNLVTADGDASNGYYLQGFALNVEVIPKES